VNFCRRSARDTREAAQEAEATRVKKMAPEAREKYEARRKKIEQNRMLKKRTVRV
jgi:hypothetical protein